MKSFFHNIRGQFCCTERHNLEVVWTFPVSGVLFCVVGLDVHQEMRVFYPAARRFGSETLCSLTDPRPEEGLPHSAGRPPSTTLRENHSSTTPQGNIQQFITAVLKYHQVKTRQRSFSVFQVSIQFLKCIFAELVLCQLFVLCINSFFI